MDQDIPTHQVAVPHLVKLPVELLLMVAAYLEPVTRDFGAFRSTCSWIESAVFPRFSRIYFTDWHCHVTMTQASLEELLDLCKSRLSSFVTCLVVSRKPLHIPEAKAWARFSCRPTDYRSAFRDLKVNHRAFSTSGMDRTMLTMAINSLPSLETVRIRGELGKKSLGYNRWRGFVSLLQNEGRPPPPPCSGHRKSNFYKKAMDSWMQMERSWKTKSLNVRGGPRRLSRFPGVLGDLEKGLDLNTDLDVRCFRLALCALSRVTPTSWPKALQYDSYRSLGERQYYGGQKALNIPEFIKPSALPFLAQLQTLSLHLSLRLGHEPGQDRIKVKTPNGGERELNTYYLRQFLGYTTKLESLHLDLHYYDNQDQFLEWLGSPSVAHVEPPAPDLEGRNPPAPVSLANLRRLSLRCFNGVSAQSLVSLVGKLQHTLKQLVLSRIALELNEHSTFPDQPQKQYSEFLRSLTGFEDVLRLQHIHIENPDVHVRYPFWKFFPNELRFNIGNKKMASFMYSGPDMRQALEGMAQSIDGIPWNPSFQHGLWKAELRYLSQ